MSVFHVLDAAKTQKFDHGQRNYKCKDLPPSLFCIIQNGGCSMKLIFVAVNNVYINNVHRIAVNNVYIKTVHLLEESLPLFPAEVFSPSWQ